MVNRVSRPANLIAAQRYRDSAHKATVFLKHPTSHLEHHLNFIHAKRAAMGKEMW